MARSGRPRRFEAEDELQLLFDATMTFQSQLTNMAVLGVYDFSGFGRIADIGGGQGGLLKAILETAPNARGVLLDLPKVVAGAFEDARMRIVPGSFFEGAPSGCDAYILKFILHDWPDGKAREILANVRKAASVGARLLVIESLRSDDAGFDPSKLMDVSMLALLGGRERTPGDFEKLFAETSFKLLRVIGSDNPLVSVIEAEAC